MLEKHIEVARRVDLLLNIRGAQPLASIYPPTTVARGR